MQKYLIYQHTFENVSELTLIDTKKDANSKTHERQYLVAGHAQMLQKV